MPCRPTLTAPEDSPPSGQVLASPGSVPGDRPLTTSLRRPHEAVDSGEGSSRPTRPARVQDAPVLSGRQDQSYEPATVSIEGTIRHDTRILRMATRDNPNSAILSADEQVQVARRAIGQYARILNVGFKNKRIAEGHFHPLPNELEDDQIARYRREYYDQQSHTIEEGEFLSTFTLCNFHLPAKTMVGFSPSCQFYTRQEKTSTE
ncbi:unnamed protein product [Umbelopsis ramanniana]